MSRHRNSVKFAFVGNGLTPLRAVHGSSRPELHVPPNLASLRRLREASSPTPTAPHSGSPGVKSGQI